MRLVHGHVCVCAVNSPTSATAAAATGVATGKVVFSCIRFAPALDQAICAHGTAAVAAVSSQPHIITAIKKKYVQLQHMYMPIIYKITYL